MLALLRRCAASSLRAGCGSVQTARCGISMSAHPSAMPAPLGTLTEEETMLKESIDKFANEIIRPKVREMDEASQMDPAIIKGLFENGFMSCEVPTEYGGANAGFFSAILAIEGLSKVDPAFAVILDVQNTLINNAFLRFGNEDIRKRFLPRLAKDTVGSYCLTEAGSGSDAFALKTVAKRDGKHYVINGSKMWISNAEHAGIFIVFANVDPKQSYRGITAFVVERNTPGLTVGKKEDKLGIRCSSTCPIHFDNVRVPAENVIGEVGKGYKYAIEMLNEGRIAIGSQMLGLAEGAFDLAVAYAKERKQFGKAIIEFQAMQHQMADTATQIEAARLLVYNAARRKQAAEAAGDHSGRSFIREAAMAKLYASQVAQMTSSRAIDWMGGVGFVKGTPGMLAAEKFYRDSKIGTIYEGTTNIQLNTIAKFIVEGQIGGK